MNDAKYIGLDGKTISPVLYRRGENISLDIPFYRTVLAEGGKLFLAALKNSKMKIIEGDYDVFGDGTVVLKFTPGHTPGHQSLYLKLARTGGVVLSGDLYHYPEDLKLNAMPEREKGPGVTEASRKALDAFSKEVGAQLWIGHDINFFSKQKHAPEYYD
jgi:glyoxylase-like metal-dependent hydrolase (beta-lactamase superfamily II)